MWRFKAPARYLIKQAKAGFGLIETIVAVALFTVIVGTGGTGVLQTFELNLLSTYQTDAALYAQEGTDATRSIARQDWANLSPGTYGLDNSGGTWALSGSSNTKNRFTRQVIIEEVERDGSGEIVESGGTVDPDTYRIISRVGWTVGSVSPQVETITYLTRYDKEITGEISSGLAWLCGTQLTSGSSFNVSTPAAIEWLDTTLDSNFYSFDAGTPSVLTIEADGDYLFSVTNPLERTDGNSRRTRVELEVQVNGTKQNLGVGRSSYIRNTSNHNQSSNHLAVLVTDLTVGDEVTIVARGLTTRSDDMTTDNTCLLAKNVADSVPSFSATATQTTGGTDLNQNSAEELEWSPDRNDTGFSHSGSTPEDIEITADGRYLVLVNVPMNSTSQRVNLVGQVLLNGSQVPAGQFGQGYIRDAESDEDSSIHWAGVVEVTSAPDVLSVSVEREAGGGTTTMNGDQASITVIKLPTEDVYLGRANDLTTGSDWNPSSPGLVRWTTDDVIDSAVYTHSTSSNPEIITVEEAGDYLLTYNDAVESNSGRPNTTAEVLVNGSPVVGAETSSHYVRGSSGHNQASGSLVYLLPGLAEDDEVSIRVSREGDNDTFDDTADAMLLLWRQSAGTLDLAAPADVSDVAVSNPAVTSLDVSWTAPGDDGSSGTAASYDLRYDTSPITSDATFNSATPVSGEPVPSVAGTPESMTVSGLTPSTTYYFALKTSDEVPNESGLSNSASGTTLAPPDTIPPGDVSDLSTSSPTSSSLDVSWTAPGDDGTSGTATTYDLRYSTAPITTDPQFAAATQVLGEPTPSVAGSSESMTVGGLSASTTYYFAIKTSDEVPNESGLSNSASGTTASLGDTTPPAAVSDLATTAPTLSSLTLTWTAPGDDGTSGTATSYDVRYRTSGPVTLGNWSTSIQASGEPTPAVAGSSESMTISGLTASTTYYFAIRTSDEVPNESGLSNSASGSTNAPADCDQYCETLGYATGFCTTWPFACTFFGGTFESGGNPFCSSGSCCCIP